MYENAGTDKTIVAERHTTIGRGRETFNGSSTIKRHHNMCDVLLEYNNNTRHRDLFCSRDVSYNNICVCVCVIYMRAEIHTQKRAREINEKSIKPILYGLSKTHSVSMVSFKIRYVTVYVYIYIYHLSVRVCVRVSTRRYLARMSVAIKYRR